MPPKMDKETMSLRPKGARATPPPKKKRRTSAEVAADKAAKERSKQTKVDAETANILRVSRKENAMATEDLIADAEADHPPAKPRTKVQCVKLVVREPKSKTAAQGKLL